MSPDDLASLPAFQSIDRALRSSQSIGQLLSRCSLVVLLLSQGFKTAHFKKSREFLANLVQNTGDPDEVHPSIARCAHYIRCQATARSCRAQAASRRTLFRILPEPLFGSSVSEN